MIIYFLKEKLRSIINYNDLFLNKFLINNKLQWHFLKKNIINDILKYEISTFQSKNDEYISSNNDGSSIPKMEWESVFSSLLRKYISIEI